MSYVSNNLYYQFVASGLTVALKRILHSPSTAPFPDWYPLGVVFYLQQRIRDDSKNKYPGMTALSRGGEILNMKSTNSLQRNKDQI